MKLNYALKYMFILFCVVTTGQVLFVGALNLIIGNEYLMTMSDLLKLPLVSFASVIPTLIFVRSKTKKTPTKTETLILPIVHFILTAGIVFGLLMYFEFMDAANAAFIIMLFLVVYIPAYIYQYMRDRKLARQLNERINAFHNTENATHHD